MSRDIKKIIAEMTVEEKASLCSGFGNWHTKAVERLNIPSIMMVDGPHGLRIQFKNADLSDTQNSLPATCFPTAVNMASTWDRNLVEEIGRAIGEE